MKLRSLLEQVQVVRSRGSLDIEVTGVRYRADEVEPGNVFCTWKGERSDGHEFVGEAHRRGAKAFVVERDDIECPEVNVRVACGRRALGLMASNYYGHPAERLLPVGITGTNGKTSVAFLTHFLLSKAGYKAGLMGTVEYRLGGRTVPATRTTPEGLELHQFMKEMVEAGCQAAVMEVSSHALVLERVAGIRFGVGVFTNLSQDHLDFHHTMEDYFAAKGRLFHEMGEGQTAVVNADDEYGARLIRGAGARVKVLSFGLREKEACYRAANVSTTVKGSRFEWHTPKGSWMVEVPWIGDYNVSNVLAATTCAAAMGVKEEEMIPMLASAPQVPGRMERVEHEGDFHVVVDYAHTPDAVGKVLGALRPLCKGRLWVLVGCGGDRDRTKRPMMARAACANADRVMFTSDNPRSEDPAEILRQMTEGVEGLSHYELEVSRETAIERVLAQASKDDVVLISGKGHEATQEIAGTFFPFSDREVALRYLKGGGR